MAQRGVGSRGSTGVVGPHGERDGVLGEGVAAWAAVRLRVQEALALLWTVVQSAPLGLSLCPCWGKIEQIRKNLLKINNRGNFYLIDMKPF